MQKSNYVHTARGGDMNAISPSPPLHLLARDITVTVSVNYNSIVIVRLVTQSRGQFYVSQAPTEKYY